MLIKAKKKKSVFARALYFELRELWESINHKYYLFYDVDINDEIPQVLHDILRKSGIFGDVTLYSHREDVVAHGNTMRIREDM